MPVGVAIIITITMNQDAGGKQPHDRIPRPRDGNQIRYLFQNKQYDIRKLKDKFIAKFISGKILLDCPQKFIDDFVNEINKILNDPALMKNYDGSDVLEDDVIYHRLSVFYQKEIAKSENAQACSTGDGSGWSRGDDRLKYITPLLKNYKKYKIDNREPIHYLDIGCNEGGITTAVGKYLEAEVTEGCDVSDSNPADRDFIFHLLDDDEKYTLSHYDDNSKDAVSCFMSLHHIEDLKTELKSIKRILKDDGVFIIREHDLNSRYLTVVIDLIHAFYDYVQKKPLPEEREVLPSFRDHFAKYYPQETLRDYIERRGFKEVCHTMPIGLWRHYQAVFVKREYYESNKALMKSLFPEKVIDFYGNGGAARPHNPPAGL
jgi:ubiquinone/menaquinone biosynthesis C-methylase UbiE